MCVSGRVGLCLLILRHPGQDQSRRTLLLQVWVGVSQGRHRGGGPLPVHVCRIIGNHDAPQCWLLTTRLLPIADPHQPGTMTTQGPRHRCGYGPPRARLFVRGRGDSAPAVQGTTGARAG